MVQRCQNHRKTIEVNGGLKKNINHSIALKNWPSSWSITVSEPFRSPESKEPVSRRAGEIWNTPGTFLGPLLEAHLVAICAGATFLGHSWWPLLEHILSLFAQVRPSCYFFGVLCWLVALLQAGCSSECKIAFRCGRRANPKIGPRRKCYHHGPQPGSRTWSSEFQWFWWKSFWAPPKQFIISSK